MGMLVVKNQLCFTMLTENDWITTKLVLNKLIQVL